MVTNLLKYYLSNCQKRINERIELINSRRVSLRNSRDIRYKKLKKIRNTHIYKNKPKIIKEIRELDSDILVEKLSLTVAQSLIDNIKLKPDLISTSSIKSDEERMRSENLEFRTLQELFWGFDKEFTQKDKFNFFLNLFLDLESDEEYSFYIQKILLDYVPYARELAFEKYTEHYKNYDCIFENDSKNNHIDTFAESVYLFCLSDVSETIMENFLEFLRSEYTYESKDSNGRYQLKKEIIHFQNFEDAFRKSNKDILEPIFNKNTNNSLGNRAYSILLDDLKLGDELMILDISRSSEEYGYYITRAEKNEMDVMLELLEASEVYIEQLENLQKDIFGNIEQEYFDSEMFLIKASHRFSEDRFLKLLEIKQIDEFESTVK